MTYDPTLPPAGMADVHITAATPEVARQVAQALRTRFAGMEQRSFPAGDTCTGTRLFLTVDTTPSPRPTASTVSGPRGHPVTGARRIW